MVTLARLTAAIGTGASPRVIVADRRCTSVSSVTLPRWMTSDGKPPVTPLLPMCARGRSRSGVAGVERGEERAPTLPLVVTRVLSLAMSELNASPARPLPADRVRLAL